MSHCSIQMPYSPQDVKCWTLIGKRLPLCHFLQLDLFASSTSDQLGAHIAALKINTQVVS